MPIIVQRQQNGPTPPPIQGLGQPSVPVGDTVYAVVFGIFAGALAFGSLGVSVWLSSPSVMKDAGMVAIGIPIVSGILMTVFVAASFAAIKLLPMMLKSDSHGFSGAGVSCLFLVGSPIGSYAFLSYVAIALEVLIIVLGFVGLYRGIRGRW